jgi:hypothetical protein
MWKDETLFRVIDENCWCPEARMKEMDEAGTVLMTVVPCSHFVLPSTIVMTMNSCAQPQLHVQRTKMSFSCFDFGRKFGQKIWRAATLQSRKTGRLRKVVHA